MTFFVILMVGCKFPLSINFVMSVIFLVLLLSQLIYAAPTYSCDWSGYDDYLAYYQSKWGTDCEEYKKYHTA